MSDDESDSFIPDTQNTQREPSHRQDEGWSTEAMNTLILHVMTLTAPGEAIPFNLRDIDWERVSWDTYTAEACQKKWEELLSKVRHYRTLFEVATDMIGYLDKKKSSAKVLHWNREIAKKDKTKKTEESSVKKKKKKEGWPPEYPQKPRSSAYAVFAVEKINHLKGSLTGKELMVRVGQLWGQLAPEEKQDYHDLWDEEKDSFLDKLMEYEASHPDDNRIKQLIEEEEKAREKTMKKNKRKSSFAINNKSPKKVKTDQQIYNELINTAETTAINNIAAELHTKKSVSDESDIEAEIKASILSPTKSSPKKTSTVKPGSSQESPVKSPSKKPKRELNLDHSQNSVESTQDSGMETAETITESPIKSSRKRPNESGDASVVNESPRKKKHKKLKVTGEKLFIEDKREYYKLKYPDLEPDELTDKVKRKYAKLSEKKTKQYEQIAAEMNLESNQ